MIPKIFLIFFVWYLEDDGANECQEGIKQLMLWSPNSMALSRKSMSFTPSSVSLVRETRDRISLIRGKRTETTMPNMKMTSPQVEC